MQPDTIFVFPGHVSGPYGERFTVGGSWPDWQRQAWINALASSGYVPQTAAWTPTYDAVSVSWPNNEGGLTTIQIGENFQFPSKATADYLAHKFAVAGKDLVVQEIPFEGLGPIGSNAVVRNLIFPNQAHLAVSGLSELYRRNPTDQSGFADDAAAKMIAAVWQG